MAGNAGNSIFIHKHIVNIIGTAARVVSVSSVGGGNCFYASCGIDRVAITRTIGEGNCCTMLRACDRDRLVWCLDLHEIHLVGFHIREERGAVLHVSIRMTIAHVRGDEVGERAHVGIDECRVQRLHGGGHERNFGRGGGVGIRGPSDRKQEQEERQGCSEHGVERQRLRSIQN